MPSATSSVVEIRGLEKTFRDFWGRPRVQALKGIDLEIGSGEVFGLLGPNGSGKSTTVKILLGLLRPTGGTASVLGGSPRSVKLKARLGYLPEESHFYPHLTGEELLRFFARVFSIPEARARTRTDELLRLVGLESARRRTVGEYSKGMLRRIGIAQALVNDPELLILDEPTSGMDPIGNRDVKELLRDLKRRGKTVILSSHLLADVEDVCDRVGILHQGSLTAVGTLESLLADDQRTQIVTDRLSPATVEAVLGLLREREGPGLRAEVGTPSSRLEEYFLRTIEAQEKAARS